MRFGLPMTSKFGAYLGSKMAACIWVIENHKKIYEIASKNPCDFLIVSLLSSWRCFISTLVVQCRSCPIFYKTTLTSIQVYIKHTTSTQMY